MALILFIIIGVCLFFRVSVEKAEHQKFEEEYEEIRRQDNCAKKEWELRVTNRALEDELMDKLVNRDDSIMDELRTTWGRYYTTEFPQYIVHDKGVHYLSDGSMQSISYYNCLRILMCNRGFLTHSDAIFGISIGRIGETEREAQLSYNRMVYFVKKLNERLLLRGIKESVYIQLTDGSIFRLDEESSRIGDIKWRPAISTFRMRLSNEERGTDFP